MGMADDVSRRIAEEASRPPASAPPGERNLRDFCRYMDALAKEFAEAAKQLNVRKNSTAFRLRGWYLPWVAVDSLSSDSPLGYGVVIRTDGTWTWASWVSSAACKSSGPSTLDHLTYESVRVNLTAGLHNLAKQ